MKCGICKAEMEEKAVTYTEDIDRASLWFAMFRLRSVRNAATHGIAEPLPRNLKNWLINLRLQL
jgi:transcription elongation factor Elf1